jgi:hypothetical protein
MAHNEAFMEPHPNQCKSNGRRDQHNHTASKDTPRKTININHWKIKNGEGGRRKIIMMPSTSVQFSLFFIFSFYANLCVHNIFYFYLFSTCVLVVVFALNQHE